MPILSQTTPVFLKLWTSIWNYLMLRTVIYISSPPTTICPSVLIPGDSELFGKVSLHELGRCLSLISSDAALSTSARAQIVLCTKEAFKVKEKGRGKQARSYTRALLLPVHFGNKARHKDPDGGRVRLRIALQKTFATFGSINHDSTFLSWCVTQR